MIVPDVNLLLSCLQETLDFEHSLERRFASADSRSSLDTLDDKPPAFGQAISEAFEPYLSIWVESQDRFVYHCFISVQSLIHVQLQTIGCSYTKVPSAAHSQRRR